MTTALEPELSRYRWSSHDEADRFPVEDPATGEVIALVQGGGAAQVNAAVEAAHRAFQADWRWRPPAERAALLLKAADVLAEHADELPLLESRENGKPVADARTNDINFLIFVFRFFGSLVDKLPTDFYDNGAIYTSTYLEPVGVVGEIIPFNWPPIHAGGNITPALLELGGKDAMIVFDDADLDRAVRDAAEGGFYNKGEACTATSRILVQDGVYDRFVEQLAVAVRKLRVGRGTNPAVHVGPVVSRLQQERVLNYIQIGIDEGATLPGGAATGHHEDHRPAPAGPPGSAG
jgi:acyl-CoA reductase-like NAD-dependent aldehyde dehydrogenase